MISLLTYKKTNNYENVERACPVCGSAVFKFYDRLYRERSIQQR